MAGFEWVVKVDGGDIAGLVLSGATISYGRSSAMSTLEPSVAYLDLVTPDSVPAVAERFPDFAPGPFAARSGFVQAWEDVYYGPVSRLTIGAPVRVESNIPGGFVQAWEPDYTGGSQNVRFTGRIASIDYRPGQAAITAVDDLERLARVTDDSKWPAEDDVTRVTRLAALAGVSIVVDGKTRTPLIARDNGKPEEKESPIRVLDAIEDAARDARAVVYADREGVIRYRTVDAPIDDTYTIPSERVLVDDLTMRLELGDTVNRAVVGWGTERLEETVEDPESIARYGGVIERTYTTSLASKEAAHAFAQAMVDAHGFAGWQVPEATVALIGAPPALVDEIASVDVDDFVTIPDLPIGGPLAKVEGSVIGYTESLDADDWQITFRLTPTRYTGGTR